MFAVLVESISGFDSFDYGPTIKPKPLRLLGVGDSFRECESLVCGETHLRLLVVTCYIARSPRQRPAGPAGCIGLALARPVLSSVQAGQLHAPGDPIRDAVSCLPACRRAGGTA